MEESNNRHNSNNEINEPAAVYQPQGPLTFEKVWQMFQETDKKFRQTDRKFQDTDRKFQDTDRKFQDTDRKFQDTDRKFQDTERVMKEQSQETDKKFAATDTKFRNTEKLVKRLSKIASGLGINVGEVTEDYFFGALEGMRELAGFKIEKVDSLRRHVKGLQGQFDAVLFCENKTIIIVEVKHKLHPRDVVRFYNNTIPMFRHLYPEHADHKILGAVAGMAIGPEARSEALDSGFLILTQSGQKISVLNPKGFKPREF